MLRDRTHRELLSVTDGAVKRTALLIAQMLEAICAKHAKANGVRSGL